MPKISHLIGELSSHPAMYGLLSVTAHSSRFGVLQGLEVVDDLPGGMKQAHVKGFPIDTNLLIGMSVLAVNIPAHSLGGWNGLDVTKLHARSRALVSAAGLKK